MESQGSSSASRREDRAFAVSTSRVAHVAVVEVSGDIDMATAAQLDDAIAAAQVDAPTAVVVDLTDVEFLASAGMQVLTVASEVLSPRVRFAVVADGPATSRVLRLVGLTEVLAVYPSRDEALRAVSR